MSIVGRIVARALAGIVVVVPMALGYGCSAPPEVEPVLRPVRSERVFARGGSRTREFSGTARAGQETDLSFRVSGTVELIDAPVGASVRAGRVLARLEQTDFQIAVRESEAALAQARATFENAEADLDRTRGLYEDGNASRTDLDSALASYQSGRARVEASVQSLERARRQLGYTILAAPVDGSIADRLVEVNENVRQGQIVVRMTSGRRPEVEVAIPEVLIFQIRDGDRVRVAFDALPGIDFDGVVTEVGVAPTGAAATFPVTVRIASESGDVRSGMAARVEFRFASEGDRDRIYLPSHAVGGDDDGQFVFVLESADEPGVGVVRRTSVEVGAWTSEGIAILSGLREGQQVVTAGVRRLTDGQRVRLEREAAGE